MARKILKAQKRKRNNPFRTIINQGEHVGSPTTMELKKELRDW